ncbi:sporulation protein [Paenibacillus swuensis]|uniref:Sporulation protein n=2 Tax=Paenibacillus swuensis TaxID=1178515 RepID=A0A172TNH7_9BACL|nr:sporulation protein YunB [Paenibacillus swuensis]ANE48611.1 sporulation protein [Paenibacillus swuensis]
MRRKRWRSQTVKPGSRKKVFFVVLVIMFFFSLQSFIFIEKNLRPPLMKVAKIRVKQIATQAINKAISDRIAQGENSQKLIDWKTDANGKVTGFMLNYAEHMKITSETIGVVQNILDDMQDIPERIPLGQAMNSAILASYGPEIPVRLVPAGNVKVDLNTRQQDAGINMILVEVYIRIIAEVAIIIPFDTKPELVETEIPISYLLVVGDVPMYYYDNKGRPVGEGAGSAPNIALPNLQMSPTKEQKEASDPNANGEERSAPAEAE